MTLDDGSTPLTLFYERGRSYLVDVSTYEFVVPLVTAALRQEG